MTRYTAHDDTKLRDGDILSFGTDGDVQFSFLGGDALVVASGTGKFMGWTIDHSTTIGVGDDAGATVSALERGVGLVHQTVLTLAATPLALADGDHGTGVKIYDFPAGDILVLGATCNLVVTSTNVEGGGATFPMALGSVVGADDNALTSTEADIIPSTAIAGGSAKDFHASLAASILFQRAGGTDLDLFLNAAITAAVATNTVAITSTGTITITWVNLGDY